MRARTAGVAVAIVLGLAACSSPPPDVDITEAFTIPGEGSLALYLTVENSGSDDRIVGAELSGADADRSDGITLHQTAHRDGLAIMEPTAAIDIPSNEATSLEPGAGHLMLSGLVGAVDLGDTLTLTVQFDRTGPVEITVEVVTVEVAVDRMYPEESAP